MCLCERSPLSKKAAFVRLSSVFAPLNNVINGQFKGVLERIGVQLAWERRQA
jgi:hypothetical protein